MKQFIAIALFAVLLAGCKKEGKSDAAADNLDFTSIRQYDIHAVLVGTEGNTSDEYTQEDWPTWVFDLFQPLDTTNLTGYVQSEISIDRLYPNPCADTQALRYFATQPVNLKLVLIDAQKNVYLRQTYALPSTIHDLSLNYKNLGLQSGTFYRMFYGFSAENKPFFYRGHIDIMRK